MRKTRKNRQLLTSIESDEYIFENAGVRVSTVEVASRLVDSAWRTTPSRIGLSAVHLPAATHERFTFC